MRSQIKTYNNRGFTIVELLIVIVVIAILAAIVVVAYNGITKQARDASLKSDLQGASNQLGIDNATGSGYPSNASQANGGQGLKSSPGNSLTYVLKPYGYCVQASNPGTSSVFALKSSTGQIKEDTCASNVTTAAGTGSYGYVDGPASTAQFSCMGGGVFDTAGNLYIGTDNAGPDGKIRKITPNGTVSTIATLAGAGNGYCPEPLTIDSAGNVYFLQSISSNKQIWKTTPGGVITRVAGVDAFGFQNGAAASARFWFPSGLAMDTAGNLYIADYGNKRIRKLGTDGIVSTFAGSGTQGYLDGTGLAAQFEGPEGLTIDRGGNLYVGDQSKIRKITPDGVVTTIAGTGEWGYQDGPGATAKFAEIDSIAVDQAGIIYAIDTDGARVRKITPDGTVSTLAGDTNSNGAYGTTDGTDTSARFGYQLSIAADPSGNIYVIDAANARIRKITQ